MPETDQIDKAAGKTSGLLTEIGRGGVRHWGGYVYDDEDLKLQGLQAIRQYRQMIKDPTVAAMLFAITSLLRSVTWRMEASDDTPAHQEARDFAEGVLFQDMDHTFEDFIADAATMLPYGFAPFEMVYRKRNGTAKGSDPVTGSLYSDGKIGLKKIALRSQDTVARWWFDEKSDDLLGLYQLDPMRGREVEIPMERLVLIRTTPNRGNPEGKSILEAAIRPYRALRVLEHAEASVAVRASGIVTMEIPVDDYNDPTKRGAWESHAREMAEDRAGFILLPTIFKEGKKLDAYKVGYTVADGRRSGDYSPIIARKKQEMAAVVLADFIFLGHNNKGALALSTDKTDLFHEAVTGWLNGIAAQVNRVILPRIWALNGMSRDLMPVATPDDLQKENLQVLGAFLTAMTSAGMEMDDALEDALRSKANLPLKPKDAEQAGVASSRRVTPPKTPKDDGLADAAPDEARTAKEPGRRPGKPAPIGKAAADDIAVLKELVPDSPAYREALEVLAGGPIPAGVDLTEGGAPATGPSPFPAAVGKHNPYHDARGRFTFAPEHGGEGGGTLKDFLEGNSSGVIVVATLPSDIQAHLGAKTTGVLLSSDTRDTHGHHKWAAEDFGRLQDVLSLGEVREDRERHVVAARFDGEWWMATVKVTVDRKEVYLQTFHRSNERQLRRFRKHPKLVRAGK